MIDKGLISRRQTCISDRFVRQVDVFYVYGNATLLAPFLIVRADFAQFQAALIKWALVKTCNLSSE
jgi:hypothetical protein